MPTYQYKREDGSIFEVFQGMNDAALTHCPETGQKVQRVITGGGGVVYKGTGWYVTDYKNNNGKSGAAELKASSTGSSHSDVSSAETSTSGSSESSSQASPATSSAD